MELVAAVSRDTPCASRACKSRMSCGTARTRPRTVPIEPSRDAKSMIDLSLRKTRSLQVCAELSPRIHFDGFERNYHARITGTIGGTEIHLTIFGTKFSGKGIIGIWLDPRPAADL